MQAIDYVIRDGAGRLSRGTIVENSDQLVLSVLDNTDVSLNISRDDVHSYRRVGNSLIIELEDGREIVLENMFEADAGLNTRLYFSENGEIHEITFSEDWGLTHYAHFNEAQGIDGMIFSDAAVETAFVTTPETTMGVAPLFVGGFGGGAALAAGAAVAGGAVLVGAGGGGSGSVNAALASNGGAITSNGTGADNIANADEIANGLTVVGYTYPNTTVDVTMGSTTLTTTSDANGNYTVSFAPTAFGPGVYTTTITATITDADGNV
ncbi:MAG: BapA/Bap/LapF family prefix-like domain-containing protein, partial [Planktomarina sp.]